DQGPVRREAGRLRGVDGGERAQAPVTVFGSSPTLPLPDFSTAKDRGVETMVKVGDKVPSATLRMIGPEGPKAITTEELFGPGKKVVAFALPGAFTPTCSAKHVPGYVTDFDKIKAKGVDAIACISVNDAFVMGAWGKDQKAADKVMMLADGSADFTNAMG